MFKVNDGTYHAAERVDAKNPSVCTGFNEGQAKGEGEDGEAKRATSSKESKKTS